MRLVAPGASLELAIIGYQFPRLATEDYDSNWLTVRIRVQHERGNWSAQDPCLLTYEAAALADWLEAVATGRETTAQRGFTEPNLRFQLRRDGGDGPVVRVYFALESRPRWAPDHGAPQDDFFIDFPAEPAQLSAAAADLRAQLRQYPQRAER